MALNTTFTEMTGVRLPIIMAPMFLVSNEAMLKAAMTAGLMAVFPSLNYREEGKLEDLIKRLHAFRAETNAPGDFGVNMIVQRSNPLYKQHLKICTEGKVPFYITSLGNPAEVIEQGHAYGAKIFCDVTNLKHAKIVFDQGCDGFIAVGQGAGGHAGPYPLQVLVPSLQAHFPGKPVIAAGGIASGRGITSMLALGASGVSIGTRFIASSEASVNAAYKDAIVDSGMEDIVLTTKISGTPCTIINTPYAKKIGYKQNWLERWLSKNRTTRKYFKMMVQIRGMKKLESSVMPANYKTLWCAGQSVELVEEIMSVEEITNKLETETKEALASLAAVA